MSFYFLVILDFSSCISLCIVWTVYCINNWRECIKILWGLMCAWIFLSVTTEKFPRSYVHHVSDLPAHLSTHHRSRAAGIQFASHHHQSHMTLTPLLKLKQWLVVTTRCRNTITHCHNVWQLSVARSLFDYGCFWKFNNVSLPVIIYYDKLIPVLSLLRLGEVRMVLIGNTWCYNS